MSKEQKKTETQPIIQIQPPTNLRHSELQIRTTTAFSIFILIIIATPILLALSVIFKDNISDCKDLTFVFYKNIKE